MVIANTAAVLEIAKLTITVRSDVRKYDTIATVVCEKLSRISLKESSLDERQKMQTSLVGELKVNLIHTRSHLDDLRRASLMQGRSWWGNHRP